VPDGSLATVENTGKKRKEPRCLGFRGESGTPCYMARVFAKTTTFNRDYRNGKTERSRASFAKRISQQSASGRGYAIGNIHGILARKGSQQFARPFKGQWKKRPFSGWKVKHGRIVSSPTTELSSWSSLNRSFLISKAF